MKIDKPIDYRRKRREAYPEIGDQLDAIIKTLSALDAQGVPLPEEGRALISNHQAVKNKYPKKV